MRARVLTALALIPPVLAAIFCTSPGPILSLLLLIGLIGIGEIHRLTGQVVAVFGFPFVLVGAVALSNPAFGIPNLPPYGAAAVGCFIVFLLAVISILLVPVKPKRNHPLGLLFSGWLVGPLTALYALHQSPMSEETWLFTSPVLLAVLPLWAGDTAAIFAGKAFGKHKLAPTISPKKTVEGGIANLVACILAAWGIGTMIGIPAPQALTCGAAAGIFGQAGDLFESWVKRRADMKDSGTLLPGHGGILDRIDSILFTAPLVALILTLWK
jgi:phosphatidate cytidylyltransferase